MKSFIVKEKCNLKYHADFNCPQASFCFFSLLRNKDIKVNGVRVSKNVKLEEGDEVEYYLSPSQQALITHNTVYEDENIIIADKYSGVTSEGLLAELRQTGEYYAVHRLDRNTEGLIVFAKTGNAEKALSEAFAYRKIQKSYLAVCKNAFKKQEDILCAYLLKDSKNSRVSISDKPVSGAVKIITEYSVLERRGDTALVKIILHTGKTHQIRAHLAHIGCPVLGDGKYGDEIMNKKYKCKRQRLVAKSLKFSLNGDLQYLNDKIFESAFIPDVACSDDAKRKRQ